MELKTIGIGKPDDVNCIIGQAHFIKTVEDLYEALVQAVPGIKFGVSFCEASGPCLIRHTGTDAELEKLAVEAAAAIGAGHVFVILLGNAFPVNVLNAVKAVPEVCRVFCATANPLRVVVACDGSGSGRARSDRRQRAQGRRRRARSRRAPRDAAPLRLQAIVVLELVDLTLRLGR